MFRIQHSDNASAGMVGLFRHVSLRLRNLNPTRALSVLHLCWIRPILSGLLLRILNLVTIMGNYIKETMGFPQYSNLIYVP